MKSRLTLMFEELEIRRMKAVAGAFGIPVAVVLETLFDEWVAQVKQVDKDKAVPLSALHTTWGEVLARAVVLRVDEAVQADVAEKEFLRKVADRRVEAEGAEKKPGEKPDSGKAR